MGVFGELMESSKRSYLVDTQARLSSLLADKAAGKDVSQSTIRSAMFDVETTQHWLSRYDQQRQQQAYADENVKQDFRRSQEARQEAFQATRAAQREADFKTQQNYRKEVLSAATTFKEAMEEIAFGLNGVLLDDESITLDEASRLLLRSLFGITAEDAKLLGPDFLAARAWIKDAEDPAGKFSTTELASSLNPDDFETDYTYRIEVAAEIGKELLAAALAPWTSNELDQLSIEYSEKPNNKYPLNGPFSIAGKVVYCYNDIQRGQMVFKELNEETWELKKWIAVPLPKAISDATDYVHEERSSNYFAFDQTGEYVFVYETLYKISPDSKVSKIASIDKFNIKIFDDDRKFKVGSSDSNVTQQLISTSATQILFFAISDYKNWYLVAIDIFEIKVLWKEITARCHYVGEWHYDPEKEIFMYMEWHDVVEPIIQSSDNRSFIQRIFKKPAPEVKPNHKFFWRFVQRNAVTGKVIEFLDLISILPDKINSNYSMAFKVKGSEVHLFPDKWTKNRQLGILDPINKKFTEISFKPTLNNSRLGSCRLHTIIQLLNNRGLGVSYKGEVIEPDAKIILR